jgi:hypothetical protein
MDRLCSTYLDEEKGKIIWSENLKEKDHLGVLEVDGRVIREMSMKKCDRRLNARIKGELFWTRNKLSVYTDSWLAEELLTYR